MTYLGGVVLGTVISLILWVVILVAIAQLLGAG
jgi:hypothetical protein